MSYNPYQQSPVEQIPSAKSNLEYAKAKVRTPAILMLVSAIVNTLAGIGSGVMMPVIFFGMREELEKEMANDPEMTPELIEFVINLYGWGGIAFAIISVITGIIIVTGSLKMMSVRAWGFALFAAILSLIPCVQSCWLMSLPIGIYALVVLCDTRVKAAFE